MSNTSINLGWGGGNQLVGVGRIMGIGWCVSKQAVKGAPLNIPEELSIPT